MKLSLKTVPIILFLLQQKSRYYKSFMKTLLLIFYFLFSVAYCIAQNDSEKSLLEKLGSAVSDTLKAEIYIDLHNAVFVSDVSKTREYAKKILEFGTKGGSLRLIQKGYMALARCERKNRNYEAVYPLDIQSIEYAKKFTIPAISFRLIYCLLLII